jgi:hypothetical protein
MLWRTSYAPVVLRESEGTPLISESLALIGSFGLSASREIEVWWRLFEEDFDGEVVELLVTDGQEAQQIADLRPPSRKSRIRTSADVQKWKEAVGEIPDGRAFCMLIQDGVAIIRVIGPPTEEVWDEVSTLWRTIRT